jgi:hypothetical protein
MPPMTVHVIWNTIRDPEKKKTLEHAVIDALGHHTHDGHWDVKLTESAALPGWTVVVVAPNGAKIAWSFRKPNEGETTGSVRSRIEALLSAAGL